MGEVMSRLLIVIVVVLEYRRCHTTYIRAENIGREAKGAPGS